MRRNSEPIAIAAKKPLGVSPHPGKGAAHLGVYRHEIAAGVVFWGCELEAELTGVMGIQDVLDVTLIRHAYVRTAKRNQGIGRMLLAELLKQTTRPVLVGTWAAAEWAVRFYQRHGFRLVTPEEKDRLLRKYWSIPDRQIETSVVLADERWWAGQGKTDKGEL